MFLDFVNEEGIYKAIYTKDPPDRIKPALRQFAAGLTCVVIYAVFNNSCGPENLISSEFEVIV